MAFAAVGASTFAHAQHAGIPWAFSMLLAGLVAVPVGALAAVPSFRLSGVYLAVATFGLGLLLQNLVYTTFLMFGSADFQTVKRPVFPGLHLSTDEGYFYLSLVIAVLCAITIVVIRRTRLGRLLRALSDSPAALDAHAANTRVTRLYVFCIAAFMAGIGGAVIAGVTRNASGQATGAFGYFNSLAIVAVLAFCWRRPILSPLVAAFIFEVIKIYKPFNDSLVLRYEGVAFGLLALGVAVLPQVRIRLRDGDRQLDRLQESPVASRRRLAAPARVYL
jgi:ABC-type branched-subunit amino acid transport system permease subunit